MKTSDILREGKALIDSPDKWTYDTFARDAFGQAIEPDDRSVVQRDSWGALCAVAGEHSRAWKFLSIAMDGKLMSFDDYHTHAQVMEAWDRAISYAEALHD